MTTDTIEPLVPHMRSEAGFELEDSAVPLRISGFICLIFGVMSFFCTLFQTLLVLPLIAFVLGFVALRSTDGRKPIGARPAMVGMVLAAGFGACGLFLPWMKTMTLGRQAEHFSRQYMEVIARGHDTYAMELRKDYVNRFPTTMPLEQHYSADEMAHQALVEFKEGSLNGIIRDRGPNAEWVLDRPTRIYYSYSREHAEVVWTDPRNASVKIQFFLEYRPDHRNSDGQWHVRVAQSYRERIVAESVL